MKRSNEYERAEIVSRSQEIDLSRDEWQWIDLAIGILGALAFLTIIGAAT